MQLVTEQLGGSVFNFQGSTQSSYCSSNEEIPSHPGASFSYSAESFTSNLFQHSYRPGPGGATGHPLQLFTSKSPHGSTCQFVAHSAP